MDRGDIPLGDLCYGGVRMFLKVGRVVEFITTVLEEVKHMLWCANQKAINIIDWWPSSFDDFYDVWNGFFGKDAKGTRLFLSGSIKVLIMASRY
jgi:hypothetical protein